MALQRDTLYPGRWTAANAAHPQGAFKNRTAPGALDGSYIEQDWANDWDGYFSALLGAASISPNGTVDTATSSQYYAALSSVIGTNLTAFLPKRVFAVNDFIRIPDVAGGLIIQWGTFITSSGGYTNITFPTPFPNTVRAAVGNVSGTSSTSLVVVFNPGAALSTIPVAVNNASNAHIGTGIRWIAIGN